LREQFLVLLGLAGIVLPGSYVVVGRHINRTVISVDSELLSVHHGPMPWAGNRAVPAATVKQLYVEQKALGGSESGIRHAWDLSAVTTSGAQVRLLTGLADRATGLFIEQQVERPADQGRGSGRRGRMSQSANGANFGSVHSNCMSVFCDGSVHAISFTISTTVWGRLCSINDGNATGFEDE
jgi:hypothetical protein